MTGYLNVSGPPTEARQTYNTHVPMSPQNFFARNNDMYKYNNTNDSFFFIYKHPYLYDSGRQRKCCILLNMNDYKTPFFTLNTHIQPIQYSLPHRICTWYWFVLFCCGYPINF